MTPYKNISIVIAALVSLTALYSWVDSQGYNRAVTELAQQSADKIAEATDKAIKDAEKEISEAQKRNRLLFDEELKRAKDERIVEVEIREVINEVEKIKYVNNCGRLNDDSIKLLNKSISRVNSTSKN